jgi:anaphase-promoting complex subunit 1
VFALSEHYSKYKCFESSQRQKQRQQSRATAGADAWASAAAVGTTPIAATAPVVTAGSPASTSVSDLDSDGLQTIERVASEWRFTEDERMHEVCRLVRSSRALYLKLEKAPETSAGANDIAGNRMRLQIKLLTLCRRSLSLPIGRGMITLGSLTPQLAEPIPIPPLPLFGRTPPNNSLVSLDTTAAPPALTLWPEFHNAVAAGLRLSSVDSGASLGAGVGAGDSKGGSVTKSWIQYMRSSNIAPVMGAAGETGSKSNSLAGVLLALGLMRYLGVLNAHDILDFLTMVRDLFLKVCLY